jgi:capsular exopolysaccharide synthesis family protein
MERGLRSSEEIYRYLRQPCLGLVPAISRLRLRGLSPEDYVVKHPISAVAEAIRSVRTGIFLSDSDVKLNGIVVTSARPNEGKTSISISMARLNAMGGRRTILIDLDLRKPEIYRRLRAPSDVGIIDYLAGKATLPEIIQKDEPTGLEYIVAGRRIANFAELLRSSLLEELLSDLSRRYDLVVLDAPPVLAAADTRLIARFAGKTLFVVRWSSTPRHVVRLALNQLIDAGTDIAGVAVTLVDVRRNRKYSFGDSEAFTGAYKRYYAG